MMSGKEWRMDDNGWCECVNEGEKKRKGQSDWRTDNVHSLSEPSSLLSLHFAWTLDTGNTVNCSPSLNVFWECLFCIIGQMPSCLFSDALNSEVNSLSILHLCPPPSSNSVPLLLLGQSIQLGLMSPRAHTYTCECVAFPWQHQCETHSPLSTVPLICISFAWFASNQWHLTLQWRINCHDPVNLSLCVAHPPCHFAPRYHVRYCRLPWISLSLFPDFLFFPRICDENMTFTSYAALPSPFRAFENIFHPSSPITEHLIWKGAMTVSLLFRFRTHNFILSAFLPSFIYWENKHTAATKTHRCCCCVIATLTLASGTLPSVNTHVCSENERCLHS